MLTKEFRIEENVVVAAINEETRVMDIMVNGDRVHGGELKDDVDAQAALDDFGEGQARGIIELAQEKAYLSQEHEYEIKVSYDTMGGAFNLAMKAESEGDHFVVFTLSENLDDGPRVVYQTRKELNEPVLAGEQIAKFDEEIANQITMMIIFNGSF